MTESERLARAEAGEVREGRALFLGSLLQFSELLRAHLGGTLDSNESRYLYAVRDAAKHLVVQVDDVVELAKVEAEKIVERAERLKRIPLILRAIEPRGVARAIARHAVVQRSRSDLKWLCVGAGVLVVLLTIVVFIGEPDVPR